MRMLATACLLALAPVCALAQGPVLLVGIDTEFGHRPANSSHGSIATWANIIQNGLLANVTNGNMSILVIGGGKNPNDEVTDFWTQIGNALGRPVVFVHETKVFNKTFTHQISLVNFANYALVAVANSEDGTGKLTWDELSALNDRRLEIRDYLCNGGALFASSDTLPAAYGYLFIAAPVLPKPFETSDVTPTADGALVGITATNLDGGPWHNSFTLYPGFLRPLATITGSSAVAALGGISVGDAKPVFTLPANTFCVSQPIIANATSTVGETAFFWAIQQVDKSTSQGIGPEITQWFEGEAGQFDLRAYASSHGLTFECNKRYAVKLAISSLCGKWHETTQFINISCPVFSAGPDKCCQSMPFPIGGSQSGNVVGFTWSPSTNLNDSHAQNPTFSPWFFVEYPLTLTLTATDVNDCQMSDTMTIYCGPPTASIAVQKACCTQTLTVTGTGIRDIQWSTGANTPSIEIKDGGIYTVTVGNACGQTSTSVTIPENEFLKGAFPTLIYPSGFTPNGDGDNDVFIVRHFGIGDNDLPAYNATEYTLSFFDQAEEHVIATGSTCTGFGNGTIQWDGKWNGKVVQDDVYTWMLRLRNCDRESEKFTRHKRRRVCTKYGWFSLTCFCKPCKEWIYEEYEETKTNDSVVVLK